ncbi:hypothetical protein KR222_009233, partial [Zaprionus bogoriensis]
LFKMIINAISCRTRHFSSSAISQLIGQTNLRNSTPEAFRKLREIFCEFERNNALSSNVQLTEREVQANDVIMALKTDQYNKGILNPIEFVPSYNIFDRLKEIAESSLFRMIQQMPKGGALKTHDASLCSTDFLIGLTYKKDLWVYSTEEGCNLLQFRFTTTKPEHICHKDGKWQTMEDLRNRRGEEAVNKTLNQAFSMYSLSNPKSNADAWQHLLNIFRLVDGLLRYYPIWGEYFYNALKEFNEDGVQYVEVRSLLPRLYCLEGHRLPVRETVKVYQEQLERFQSDNPDFIGSKLIYSPMRHVPPEQVGRHIDLCTELNVSVVVVNVSVTLANLPRPLQKEFPNLLVGFDLVGHEDLGHPLSMFVEQLLRLPKQMNFYFHAGQTNWYGSHVDENLIDAVLLGTRRIGHGYAITKHPLVMELVKKCQIAIEVCPVGNQVLQMGSDYRNHPAATLIANDIPFVLSSGNPSFCRTKPLSHDFYIAFLGIAPRNADLRFLKRIAKSSIKYSALSDEEKSKALVKWKLKWEKWIEWIIEKKGE